MTTQQTDTLRRTPPSPKLQTYLLILAMTACSMSWSTPTSKEPWRTFSTNGLNGNGIDNATITTLHPRTAGTTILAAIERDNIDDGPTNEAPILLESPDGVSWTPISLTGLTATNTSRITTIASNDTSFWVGTEHRASGTGALYKGSATSGSQINANTPDFPASNTAISALFIYTHADTEYLLAGTRNGSGAQLLRTLTSDTDYSNDSWEPIADFSIIDADNTAITAIISWEGNLYIGTENTATGSEVYSAPVSDLSTWTLVSNTDNGFGTTFTTTIETFAIHNDELYAGTRNPAGAGLWHTTDGSNWNDQIPPGMNIEGNIAATGVISFDNDLWIAISNNTFRSDQVWKREANGEFSQKSDGGLDSDNPAVGASNLCSFEGKLYWGGGNSTTGAEIRQHAPAVSHWPFDSGAGTTAMDAKGNDNGDTEGTFGWQDDPTAPISGGDSAIDLQNATITLSESQTLGTSTKHTYGGSFTFSGWIYPRDTHQGVIIDALNGVFGFRLELESTALKITANGPSSASSSSIESNQWTHVALTSDGSTLTMFINGVADPNTLSGSPASTGTASTPAFGSLADNSGGHFNGSLDEFKLYDYPLSADEIRTQSGYHVPAFSTTISGAVNHNEVEDGDTIVVAPKSSAYTDMLYLDTKRLAIIGSSGSAATIIDAGGSDSVVFAGSNSTLHTRLIGLTLRGGFAGAGNGGGVSVEGGLIMEDCIVTHNVTEYFEGGGFGGGIYVGSDGELAAIDCKILENEARRNFTTAGYGGGISVRGKLHLRDSEVVGNVAKDEILVPARSPNGSGGGIIIHSGGEATIENSIIAGNIAEASGGGIVQESGGYLTVRNTIIAGNTASVNGGGLHCDATEGETVLINNTIVANHATGDGAGLWIDEQGSSVVANNVFQGNSIFAQIAPESNGFEEFLHNVAETLPDGTLGVNNVTSVEVHQPPTTSSLTDDSTYDPLSNVTTIVDKSIYHYPGSLEHKFIQYPSNGDYVMRPIAKNGRNQIQLHGDVTSDTTQGTPIKIFNLRLARANSPAVNAGKDPNPLAELAPEDFDGEPRIADGVVDAGADEFHDQDGDEIPDLVEQDLGFPLAVASSNNDTDGDGFLDWYEYHGNSSILSARSVPAATLYVDTTGDDGDVGDELNPLLTIQEAIDRASNGDVILIRPGFYSGLGNVNLDTKGLDLMISGEGGPDAVVIDGGGTNRAFVFDESETARCTIANLTLESCMGVNGGAMVLINDSSPTLLDLIFRDCEATDNGGAVAVLSGDPVFARCDFINNVATKGGAVTFAGTGTAGKLDNCRFKDNGTTDTKTTTRGGAIHAANSTTPEIVNCIIGPNNASLRGAGIANEGGTMLIRHTTISENHATNDGGGLYNSGSTMTIQNTIVWGNTTAGLDLAINKASGVVVVSDSVIEGGFAGGTNVSNGDPLFRDPINDDFGLQLGSPAIDLGDAANQTPRDFEHTDRVGPPDAGALEFSVIFVDSSYGPNDSDGSLSKPFKTIIEAMNVATEGAVLVLADGIYTGVNNRNVNFGGMNVTIQSANGPDFVTINCEGADRAFVFENEESRHARLEGLTMINGGTVTEAGLVLISEYAEPEIIDCVLVGSTTTNDGGAIGIKNRANPVIERTIITNCSSSSGNGGAIAIDCADAEIRGSAILGNTAPSGSGGGISVKEGSVRLENVVVSGNSASNGGAMFLDDFGFADLLHATIIDNAATGSGGGIYLSSNGNATIVNSIVTNLGLDVVGPNAIAESTIFGDSFDFGNNGNTDTAATFLAHPSGTLTAAPAFSSSTGLTVVTDTGASLVAGSLRGLLFNPNPSQNLTFWIHDNSETTITVLGDLAGTGAGNGVNYAVKDFRLADGSEGVDTANISYSSPEDFEGIERYDGSPDRGADEYTRPTVKGVFPITADGIYGAATIEFELDFFEPVFVTGTGTVPQVSLETGATDAMANYVSGSGTNRLKFAFDIEPGMTTSDLATKDGSLTVNDRQIINETNQSIDLGSLPLAGTPNALDANAAIEIDSTHPGFTSVSIFPAHAKVGDSVTVAFTMDTTLGPLPSVTINGNAGITVIDKGGNSYEATRVMQPGDTEGTVSFQIDATGLNGLSSATLSTTNGSTAIFDKTAPMLTCPPSFTQDTDTEQCYAILTFSPSVHDNLTATSLMTTSLGPNGETDLVSGSQFPIGTSTITFTAQDAAGNTSNSCTLTITIVDDEVPTISCPPNRTVNVDEGTCVATGVDLSAPSTGDNCGVDSVVNNAPGSFSLGDTAVTWTVTDSAGNTAECTQIVTVIDNDAPTISCPSAITVNVDAGTCVATGVDLGTPSTGDNCAAPSVAHDATGAFSLGDTTVTWTATDAAGNTAKCTQIVTVIDNEAPTIACPSDVTVNVDAGTCVATRINLGTPTADDNCAAPSVAHDAPGAFSLGDTTVTWTTTDAAGNTAACTQVVTVIDNEAPTIACPSDVTVNVDAGTCVATDVNLSTPSAGDNCAAPSVAHDAPGTFPLGDTTVTWTTTDAAGNTTQCTQVVTVIDNEAPTIACPSDVTVNVDSGTCVATRVNLGIPTASDNCAAPSVTHDAPGTFSLGDTTVTWTTTDGAGNTAACTQVVTVIDNEAPAISCPSAITVNVDAGTCVATGVDLGTPSTGDNCAAPSVAHDAPGTFSLGDTTVTWTTTDAAGNTAECTQIVTVIDNEAPTIACPSNVMVTISAQEDSGYAEIDDPTISDHCDTSIFFYNDQTEGSNASGSYNVGTTTVTYTAMDAAGNSAQCSFLVTVTREAPATIGNFVWNDLNENGIQDVGEPGIDGILVALLDEENEEVDQTTTDSLGFFSFTAPAGDYQLEFDTDIDYITTVPGAGSDASKDSNVGTSPITEVFTVNPGENRDDLDAGFICTLQVGGGIYRDLNGNDVFDGGIDLELSGVTVELWQDTNGTLTFTGKSTLSVSGQYVFSNVNPGDYRILIPTDNFATNEPLHKHHPVSSLLDPETVEAPEDNNGSLHAAGVATAVITLARHTEPTTEDSSTCTNFTIGFGFNLDNTPPIFSCDQISGSVQCQSEAPPIFTTLQQFEDAGGIASDNGSGLNEASFQMISESGVGGCPNLIRTNTEYEITDNSGNVSTCTVVTVIRDTTPPTILPENCPSSRTIPVTTGCQAAVPNLLTELTATDNCTIASITQSPPAGTMLGTGTHTITFTVTDACAGNTASCTTELTVAAPSLAITCDDDVIETASFESTEIHIDVAPPQFNGGCGTLTLSNDYTGTNTASGMFPVGATTEIVWTVTDGQQPPATTTCTQRITVNRAAQINADLDVSQTVPTNASVDTPFEIDYEIENLGSTIADSPTIQIQLPESLTIEQVTVSGDHSSSTTTSAGLHQIALTPTSLNGAEKIFVTVRASRNAPGSVISGITASSATADLEATNNASSESFSIAPGSPVAIAFVQQPLSVAVDSFFDVFVELHLIDRFGNVATTTTKQIVLALEQDPNQGNTAIVANGPQTPINGIVQFPHLRLRHAGAGFTLTASANGLPTIESDPFDVFAVGLALLDPPLNGETGMFRQLLAPRGDEAPIVLGIADFNGDGHDQILAEQPLSHELHLIGVNNDGSVNSTPLPSAFTSLEFIGLGDFNGDDTCDMLCRNRTTGDTTIHFMNGASVISSATLSTVDFSAFEFIGAGKFDSNDADDLVVRNRTTSEQMVMLWDGSTVGNTLTLPASLDSFTIADVVDFDLDGRSDFLMYDNQPILWEARQGDPQSTVIEITQVNPLPISQPQLAGSVVGNSWRPHKLTPGNYHVIATGTAGSVPEPLSPAINLAPRADTGASLHLIRLSPTPQQIQLPIDPNDRILGQGDFNGDGIPETLFETRTAMHQDVAAWAANLQGSPTAADSPVRMDAVVHVGIPGFPEARRVDTSQVAVRTVGHYADYPFYMGETAINVDQFMAFLNNERNNPQSNCVADAHGNVFYGSTSGVRLFDVSQNNDVTVPDPADEIMFTYDIQYSEEDGYTFNDTFSTFPIMGVTWYGAIKYCNWLAKMKGLAPSEYAFKEGPEGPDWHPAHLTEAEWADGFNNAERLAWLMLYPHAPRLPMDHNSASAGDFNEYRAAAAPNGQIYAADDGGNFWNSLHFFDNAPTPGFYYAPNQFGLFDLSGNSWEWQTDTETGGTTATRAVRGGSWFNYQSHTRTDFRFGIAPERAFSDVSFRCVSLTNGIIQAQIATDSAFSNVIDQSYADANDWSGIHSWSPTLSDNEQYYWRYRWHYPGLSGSWSDWNLGGSFRTTAQTPTSQTITATEGWTMTSLAIDPGTAHYKHLFGMDSTVWIWDSVAQQYVRPFALQAFDAFWLLAPSAAAVRSDVSVSGFTPRSSVVTLRSGWNLIGPRYDDTPLPTDPAIRRIQRYEAGAFESALDMDRGGAYWIFSNSTVLLNLGADE